MGHGLELDLFAGVDGVARCQRARVDEAHDIARVSGIHGIAGAAKDRQCILGGKAAPGLGVVDLHAALEFTGNHAHKRQVIAVLLVHARLHLENDAGKVIGHLAHLVDGTGGSLHGLGIGFAGMRRWGDGAQGIQDLVDAEVQHGRGEDERGGHALFKELLIVQGAIGGKELGFFHRGLPHILFLFFCGRRIVVLLRCDGGTTGGADEVDVIIGLAVIIDVS